MLILKHVAFEMKSAVQVDNLLAHIEETTSQVEGVTFNGIYFVKDQSEFVLFLESDSENKYLEWREICPPPPGAKDWYEILLTKEEQLSKWK